MRAVARILLLVGAAGVVLSAFMPWVTVKGAPVALDLDWIGADISPGGKTVSGSETQAWPVVAGVGGLVALLTVFNVARKLLVFFGLLVVAAGAGLIYYVTNVVDIEASDNSIKQALANAALDSSAQSGPFVLLAGGACILLGALALRR